MGALDGKVVAFVCRGSEADRALAVALAEAGADIALGTVTSAQAEEFGTASIANEVWAIGREQMNSTILASDALAAAAFAAEVEDRLGRCDVAVIAAGSVPAVEFDELSADEWVAFASEGLAAPLFCAQALSRVIERCGGGAVIFVADAANHGDVANSMLVESVRALAANLGIAWRGRNLRALMVSRDGAPEVVVAALS